jgi:DNA-binding transcriptional LysR family regulator
MDLRHFRAFVAVAEELHFARAAEKLGSTQPAVSQHVKAIEQEMGVSLLWRTKRSVKLTEAGSLFLEEARIVLQQADHAVRIGRRAGRGELGKLHIGYVASAAYTGLLPDIVRSFRKTHPEVQLSLHDMEMRLQIVEIENAKLDIGFIRPPVPLPSSMVCDTLFLEPVTVALPQDHRLVALDNIPAASLGDEAFILPNHEPGVSFYEHTVMVGRHGGFQPRIVQRGRDFLTILSMVSMGLGIAIVPTSMRRVHLPGIIFRDLADLDHRAQLSLTYSRNNRSPTVLSFVRIANEIVCNL